MKDNYKNFKPGDLVCYRSNNQTDLLGECPMKIGTVIEVNPVLGSGFQTAEVFWADDETKETVVINYLHLIND